MGKFNKDKGYPVWWLLVVWIVLLLMCFLLPSMSEAHDIHFNEMIHQQCPVVARGWVYEVGYVFATDCEEDDGIPDAFWLLYKDGDLTHNGLHITPLTQGTAKWMLNITGQRRVRR